MLDDRVDPSEHSYPAVWVNKVPIVDTNRGESGQCGECEAEAQQETQQENSHGLLSFSLSALYCPPSHPARLCYRTTPSTLERTEINSNFNLSINDSLYVSYKTLIIFLFSKLDTEALYFLFVNVLKY